MKYKLEFSSVEMDMLIKSLKELLNKAEGCWPKPGSLRYDQLWIIYKDIEKTRKTKRIVATKENEK